MNVQTKTSNNTFLIIKPIVTIVLLLIGHYFVAGQSNPNGLMAYTDASTSTNTESWAFLSGTKSMYYLDFDELDFQLEHIELKSISGKVLFQDEVSDLSTFTLYELDFTAIPNGEYYLELKTKNKTLRKLLKLINY